MKNAMKILIVDDEPECRTLLKKVLTGEGYEVRAADGGPLALVSLGIKRPDLILLDIRMPGMDGFEVCRRIKENIETRDIPVVFLSASNEVSERVQGLQLGAVDYVSKPFQREELLARVRTHLELHRFRTHLEALVCERTAELRESEERFRMMADAAPVMIWDADVNKLCTFFSKGWIEFTGRDMSEELGNGWAAGVHPEDLDNCYGTYCSAFDARRSFEMEYRLRRADGEYRWMLDKGVPRFLPGGAFAGYIGSCVDITDLKQTHERLLAAQKLESLELMAAGIAHDFGNMLGTMFGEADLALSEMQPDSPGRDNMQRIEALAEYGSEIVSLLRDSAASGPDSSALESLDFSSLTEETLRLVKISISKRAEVRTNLRRGLPHVSGNRTQLRQVLINLVMNAAEALGDHQGSITITTQKTHLRSRTAVPTGASLPAGEYVCLIVSDTGCGIRREIRARIFDQFFTTKSSGRGLGLAVAHGIVRAHRGAITVVSKPGAGSIFEVLLPCISRGDNSQAPVAFIVDDERGTDVQDHSFA
ncbi:MAG: response regulator [Bryobacteraceae bacterium]